MSRARAETRGAVSCIPEQTKQTNKKTKNLFWEKMISFHHTKQNENDGALLSAVRALSAARLMAACRDVQRHSTGTARWRSNAVGRCVGSAAPFLVTARQKDETNMC